MSCKTKLDFNKLGGIQNTTTASNKNRSKLFIRAIPLKNPPPRIRIPPLFVPDPEETLTLAGRRPENLGILAKKSVQKRCFCNRNRRYGAPKGQCFPPAAGFNSNHCFLLILGRSDLAQKWRLRIPPLFVPDRQQGGDS